MTFILAEEAALKEYVKGITVADKANPTRPVKVWYGYPDVELTNQDYPFVTIELIDVIPAKDRQTSGYMYDDDNRGTVAPRENVMYGYSVPLPYDLLYQVTSYARDPRHDRAIITQMLQKKFPSQTGSLLVPNELGTEVAYRSMFLDGFLKRDTVEEGRRLFRNTFTVRVISEMTPENADNAFQLTQNVNINTTTTEIPNGFTEVPFQS